MPLLWAAPATASQMTLAEAQAALALARQEVLDATEAVGSATELIASLTVARDTTQIAYNEALAAWEATKVTVSGTTSTATQNVVQNGSFDSPSGWSNVVASSTVYTGGGSPITINGKLKGSYTAGVYISQSGTFPSPTRQVTFGVDVWNYDTNENNRVNNPDYYRIEFRTYNAAGQRLNYYNLEWSQWHDSWITRGATYNLSDDAVRWDVGFRMADAGYWAGAFGPEMDNVRVIATMNTTTPTTYTYGEAETVTKDLAYDNLQSAQSSLTLANLSLTQAQTRLSVATTEVARLESLIIELTPPWWQISFWEGELVSIGAPEGYKFGSPRAWYGSPTDESCGADVSSIVNELINGRSAASFSADNGVFGDPCGGVVKVLRLSTPVDSIPVGPTPEEIAAEEARLAAEQAAAEATRLEAERVAAEAAAAEAARIAAEQAAAAEAARLEAERLEAERIAAEAARLEAERLEAERLAREAAEAAEAARLEAERLEKERLEAERLAEEAAAEAARLEAERLEAEEKARLEAIAKAKEEAERLAAEEKAREEAEANKPMPTPTASPEPEPEPTEKPTVEIKEEISAENITAVVEELATITPQDLTQEQQTLIVEAALETFASAEQGSAEYEAALDALLVVAQADDIVLNEELAAIPLIGNVAGAAVEVFNALGNAGADMSPQVREQSEKVVIAAVIVGQVAMTATAAATSAAAAAARRP